MSPGAGAIQWKVVGVDPAPKKPTLLYDGKTWHGLAPRQVRAFLAKILGENPATVVAWDAPLSFDRSDFYDRKVDKVARAWAGNQVLGGRFAEGAINARAFAGLPHWVISCVALGFPFGAPPGGLQLTDATLNPRVPGRWAVEVHPAVALGALWLDRGIHEPLPRYKGDPGACAGIVAAMGFPRGSGETDDHLDSYVAHYLGVLLVRGGARFLGSLQCGGYLMPAGRSTAELGAQLELL